MRSTGGFVPVRVWVSYESMARGKSVQYHPKCLGHMKQRARAGLCVVLVYGPWRSRAVHWPHTGQKLLWVIPPHAVRASKLFPRFFYPHGRHSVRSWKLSLHNFPTRAFYDFGTTEGSYRRQSYEFLMGSHTGHRHTSHVRAPEGPVWVLTTPYGSAFKTTVRGSCGPRTGAKKSLRVPHEQLQLITVGLHTGVHKPVRHPQVPVLYPRVHRTEPEG